MTGAERASGPRFDKSGAVLVLLGVCAVVAAQTALKAVEAQPRGAGPWAHAEQTPQFDRPGERP